MYVCVLVCVSMYVYVCVCVCVCVCVRTYLSIYLSICFVDFRPLMKPKALR